MHSTTAPIRNAVFSAGNAVDYAGRLRRVRALARLLDAAIAIPGTKVRVGLDSLIGLVPGLGDFATAAISLYIVHEANQLGLPRHVLSRMLLNVAVDMGVGAVPVLGDLFDVGWKANLKNVELMERHLRKHASGA